MADNEKAAGVPIDDEALDKVAGGTDQNLKIHVYTYQPGVLNYGAPPTQGSDKSGITVEMQEDRLNIPIIEPPSDIPETRPKTWKERSAEEVRITNETIEFQHKNTKGLL